MARHGIIVTRLNVIPSRHKKNRLFNHASRNGYKSESCGSVNPFLTVDHRLWRLMVVRMIIKLNITKW